MFPFAAGFFITSASFFGAGAAPGAAAAGAAAGAGFFITSASPGAAPGAFAAGSAAGAGFAPFLDPGGRPTRLGGSFAGGSFKRSSGVSSVCCLEFCRGLLRTINKTKHEHLKQKTKHNSKLAKHKHLRKQIKHYKHNEFQEYKRALSTQSKLKTNHNLLCLF